MYIYVGQTVSCVDYDGGSYCEVVPDYDLRCTGYTAGGTAPTDPYVPGSSVPTYVDPSWMYIEYIDDTDPASIQAVVNADPRLDSFGLYVNGDPYGTGWGTGQVAVGSLPASAFNDGDANISVQGCAYQLNLCAAASANTYARNGRKVTSGTVVVNYLNNSSVFELANHDRQELVEYKRRSYSVWSSPGNTQFAFEKALAAISYNSVGGNVVIRDEELTWQVTPGSFWANTCAMTAELEGDSIDNSSTTTDWVSCYLDGAVGASGMFTSAVTWIARQQPEGLNVGIVIAGRDLTVNVP